ncbi:ROK family glucokinase [Gryllotalpicola koreensis]|uniref:Glucokinase n=1 Tax=Gryllotalpicola koreensis TaxID=993086 RepID=A0ABP7ZYG5_9MICO
MHAIGIDIGGTKVAGALVDEDGTIVRQDRKPTPAGDSEALKQVVVDMINELADGTDAVAAGVAAPGFIDATGSIVYYTPNVPWRHEQLRHAIEPKVGVPVIIENDANAAGWAEFRFGAGRLSTDMVMLTIGTGVGGAIVANDHLFRGGFGAAGELGHMRIVPNGLPCGCGANGCIEQYGSGRALQRYANTLADAGGIGQKLAEVRSKNGDYLHGKDIGDLIDEDDPGALQALRQLGDWLGQACASFAAILDPQVFVFGGGVASAGEKLLAPVRQAFLQTLPARGYHPEPEFKIAELVNDAGVVGAADVARQHAIER